MLGSYNVKAMEYVKNDRINIFVLTMMYTGFWTLIIDSSVISQSILTLFQALSLLFGVYHFSFVLIKNMNLEFEGFYLKKPMTNTGFTALITWLFFGLSIILSELIRGSSPHVGIMYLVYIPLIFFYVIPRTLHNPIKSIVKATLSSGLIILILSILWEVPTIGEAYSGITNNTNSMGMVANQTALSSLCLFYMDFQKGKKYKISIMLYALLFMIAVLFLVVSESRTSLLVVASGMITLFIHGIITKKIKGYHLFLILFFLFFAYQFFLEDFFVAGIAEKFITFSTSSNLLAGRTGIWNSIITDSTLFGYGFEYFSDYLQIQAHNDVLQFVGMYGVISGLLLAIFFVLTSILSLQYMIKKRGQSDSIIPMVFVIAFIVLGLAETVLGFNAKTPTMVYYSIVGILLLYL